MGVEEPSGVELERLKQTYYAVYPDGPSRLNWPGLIHVRARPTWIRYSDYTLDPPQIVEFTAERLAKSQVRVKEARADASI